MDDTISILPEDARLAIYSGLTYIDFNEFQIDQFLGRGSFGQVNKAIWRNQKVALKRFSKKSDFEREAAELSRVQHENIIGFFGYTINEDIYNLVLEFADDGNLNDLLHESPVDYTLSHAISWCLQCARGVEYLHSMEILHRDLKPSNLLLINKCRTIKICDFGTARDKSTIMTNNRGTPSYMAPEVFKTHEYSEKCDVYSWSIIFWEVLTRKFPYNSEMEPYAILWNIVHKDLRPPMIRNCPQLIKRFLIDCWSNDLDKRPSMKKVIKILEKLFEFCPNEANKEIEINKLESNVKLFRISNVQTNNSNNTNNVNSSFVGNNTNTSFTDDFLGNHNQRIMRKFNPGHKRSNSTDVSLILGTDNDENDENEEAMITEKELEEIFRSFNAYLFLTPEVQPPTPNIKNTQSTIIFEEHKNLALKLLRLKFEQEYLRNRLSDLREKQLNPNLRNEDPASNYNRLKIENRDLLKTRQSFVNLLLDLKKNEKNIINRISSSVSPSSAASASSSSSSDQQWVLVDSSPQRFTDS